MRKQYCARALLSAFAEKEVLGGHLSLYVIHECTVMAVVLHAFAFAFACAFACAVACAFA